MKAYVDLHIHTALSPCAEEEMSPNNIVNMSLLKELQMVAITDHNTIGNLEAVMRVAEDTGLIVVPGVEVETSESIHMVCLFPDFASAKEMGSWIDNRLPQMGNRPDIFGEQIFYDAEDECIGHENRLLLIGVEAFAADVREQCEKLGGIAYPAHIDRPSYSMLAVLGVIEEGYHTVEISKHISFSEALERYPFLKDYHLVSGSDAHHLEDIFEAQFCVEVAEMTAKGLIEALKK